MDDQRPAGGRTTSSPAFALRVGAGTPVRLLVAATVVLSALSLGGQVLVRTGTARGGRFVQLATLLDLDQEANVPSWFQSGLLLLCAGVLWTVGDQVARRGLPQVARWRGLALVFVFLSLDELAALHERLVAPLRATFHFSGVLSYAWVVVAFPLVVALGVFYLPFLRSLPHRTAVRIALAGGLYVTGALLIEMVGSQLYSIGDFTTVAYAVESTVEELCEMGGLILFLRALDLHAQALPAPAPASAAVTA